MKAKGLIMAASVAMLTLSGCVSHKKLLLSGKKNKIIYSLQI